MFFIVCFSGFFLLFLLKGQIVISLCKWFHFSGQVRQRGKRYLSKAGFALCYASACETNTRMMQKNIKEKKSQTKNSLIIIYFYSFFSLKAFSSC